MELPDDLLSALDSALRNTPPRELAAGARELSQRYRAQHGRCGLPLLTSDLDVPAYVAYRLPATFAAIGAVLEEVARLRPDLQPVSLLDVGGGPGTAAWAATRTWPGLARLTTLDRDARMIAMGKTLAAGSHASAIRSGQWKQSDVLAPWESAPADITVAAYLIGEVPAEARLGFVRRLWEHSIDTCVVVEPGTPRGFELIRDAGDEFHRLGARIIAPFPHDWHCLESETDWCHFSQRVPRTRIQRTAKGATLAYEDEKYSYIVASRHPGMPIAARVIRHPQVRSGHVRLVLCTAAGVKHVIITRRNREAYRKAKDLVWGSAIVSTEHIV